MPDEIENDAAARAVREGLEHDLFDARQRVREAEAKAQAAREAIEARKSQLSREDAEAAAAARRAGDPYGEVFDMFHGNYDDDVIGAPFPPPDPRIADTAESAAAAEREAEAAKAEVARLQRQIDDLPPTEDILGEIDDGNPDVGGKEAGRTRRWRLAGGFGFILSALGLFLLWQSFQAGPKVAQAPQPSPSASSVAGPSRQPSVVPATASAPPPIAALPPLTGSASALLDFDRTNSCPSVPTFTAGYRVDVVDGKVTLTQLGIAHESTGTVDRTGAFETTGQDQTYTGQINGTSVGGKYAEPGGCTYDFHGQLSRPLLEAPPFGTAPGHFEFLDPQTNKAGLGLLDIAPGRPVHVIVASDGTPDVSGLLPIQVIATAGETPIWDFEIEGAKSVVCRGPTGCSGNAPTLRLAEWDGTAFPIVIVARGPSGDVIAVHAPHGIPAIAAVPSAAPSVAASVAPSAAPSASTAASTASSPPVATGDVGGGPDVALATVGIILVIGGLGLGLGGIRFGRRPRTVGDDAAAIAREIGIDPRPPAATTGSAASGDPHRDEIERQARGLEQDAAQKEAEAARLRSEETAPIEFGDAFTDTITVLGGGQLASGTPADHILGLEEDAKRLREEAAALRAQLKP